MLEAITDARVRGVVYVACSQGGGKTELILNAAGYYIDHEPSPILIVEPNVEMAEALSKDRLAPMIRDSSTLSSRVASARSRDSANTIRHKEFPGGHVTLVGANSAAGLAMRPIRVLLFDEIDRYPPSAGSEGDPVKLAQARTTAFWNARQVMATSPGYRGGQSWQLWEQTDRCEYFVPCPDCGFDQWLKWDQVHWEKDETGGHLPQTAVYVCERCGSSWDDQARWRAIRSGAYRPMSEARNAWRGFRLPAMAVIGRTLAEMATQWLEAQGNPEKLKVFRNTVLAEWYVDDVRDLDETGLMSRREQQVLIKGRPEVPAPVALLTSGVDVQDNRFEVSTWGWGAKLESWLLEHAVIFGDPSIATSWSALDEYLLRWWPREAGGVDWSRAVAVDTGGHYTQAAYEFCGPRFRRSAPDGGRLFTFAVKGQAGSGDVWPRHASKVTAKTPLWPIRVDPAKEQLYGRLAIPSPGPGYVHLPNTVDHRYCAGLVSEEMVLSVNRKGFSVRTWRLKVAGSRNEPLDCAILAYAALCGLQAMGYDLEMAVSRLATRRVHHVSDDAQSAVAVPVSRNRSRRQFSRGFDRSGLETRSDWWGR